MSCQSCSNSATGQPRGCQNNGTCGSDSCNKLTVFDWLSNMKMPSDQAPFPYAEVRFKNSRKGFYSIPENVSPSVGNVVVVEAESGYDVGMITITGELVRLQMHRKKVDIAKESFSKILRLANAQETDVWQAARDREAEVQKRAREMAIALQLEMKISDVEFQGDGKKATFYYTAEQRVDFRQLIKDMAMAFSIRIDMRQIGLRQEASRLGGIGSCGRELCCSTWLTDFRTVSTGAARYQQLSLNPQKLAGQCGKLKCCLNYELDAYRKALKNFPKPEIKLHTEKGIGVFQKMDIFKGVLWYSYKDEWMTWHELKVDAVNKIIEKNKTKETVTALEDYKEVLVTLEDEIQFEKVVGQDNLNRFDKLNVQHSKNRNRKKSKNRPKKGNNKNA